jgi:2-keto-4-pentenoate hydratase
MTPEQAYAAAHTLHEERARQGWRALGRKIGFTNRTLWPRYGVHEPMWGTVYDRTVLHARDDTCRVPLEGLAQPRIEPEVLFKLRAPPRSSRIDELVSCLDWVAHSIEIVQCRQPGWKITLAECAADNGLHGRLIVGTPVALKDLPELEARLPHVEARLYRGGVLVDRGRGENVLGSPLAALAHLVDLLARQGAAPLAAGEVISTGTLTDAHPVAAGETWRTEIGGLPLQGLTVHFA